MKNTRYYLKIFRDLGDLITSLESSISFVRTSSLHRIETKIVKNFRNPGDTIAISLAFAKQKFLVKNVLFKFFFGQAKKIKEL